MAIKLTQEAFISNVKAIHGDKYSFEKTEYVTARTPVIITCVKHQHDFEVMASTLTGEKKRKKERKYRVGSCPLCIKEYFDKLKRPKIRKPKLTKKIDNKRYYCCNIHGDVLIGKNRKIKLGCPTCNISTHKTVLIANSNNKIKLGITNTKKKSYVPYNELKKLVNGLGITSHWEYRKWRKRNCYEENTPCNPDKVYCGWISYYEFFNTSKHSKMSAGERKIYAYLQKNNIKFVWQKKFEDCRNIHVLPFDFYLPNYNLLIEFDGQQHYKIANFSKSIEINNQKFEQLKKNDAIKTKYCKDNDIKLLRLNNDDLINGVIEWTMDNEISRIFIKGILIN